MIRPITEYTEAEFRMLIEKLIDHVGVEAVSESNYLFFQRLVIMPGSADLIYDPEENATVDTILNTIKHWYNDKHLPLFKSPSLDRM